MPLDLDNSEKTKVLDALINILDYARSNAVHIGDPHMVKALDDAMSIAKFNKRRHDH